MTFAGLVTGVIFAATGSGACCNHDDDQYHYDHGTVQWYHIPSPADHGNHMHAHLQEVLVHD